MEEDEIVYCENCIHCYYDTIYGFWRCAIPPMNKYISIDPEETTCDNAEKKPED